MSVYLGTTLLAGTATETKYNANNLLDFKWSDHELNDQSWLNANTFSWQDGTVYSDAYSHLVADYSGGTSKTETIGSHTITFVEATDGHRITTDESTVADIYTESGVAWFYVLDTANQRFKLPRTKYGFNGVRDTVGKYIPETLPNITGELAKARGFASTSYDGSFYGKTSVSGSIQSTSSGSSYSCGFDASLSSSTYQNNAPVQERATQMYLYFYVGQFSQSATEQTAGLNSELFNGKADTDLNNVSAGIDFVVESYQNGTEWYRLYKSGWVEQGGLGTGEPLVNSSRFFNLLVEMKDTDYFAVAIPKQTGSGFYQSNPANIVDVTTTSISVRIYNNTLYPVAWEVKGYKK